MKKELIAVLLLALSLEARDNPFFPAEGMKEMPVTASDIQTFDPLKSAAITLPDSARVLKEVTVTYQNLDGSMGTKSISLDHSVDWHLPLFVSQSYSATRPEYQQNTEAPQKPIGAETETYKKLVDFGEAAFFQTGKKLKIVTKDRMLRHFGLVDPHRIVIDFERDADFRSKVHKIEQGKPYRLLRLGNHSGYYRAVIELDGQYRYKIDKHDGAILIECY